MPKIKIYESVGGTSQTVTDYASLENHHPSKQLQESGRVYARVGGEAEEILGNYKGTAVLTPGGEYMVSKDMVLTAPGLGNGEVPIPSPASGVIGKIDRDDGVITINDPKTGDTMFQIRHAKIDPNLKAGDKVEYGQPLGEQHGYNNGNPSAFPNHVHFDVNTKYIVQADRWIKDMHAGTITTDTRPTTPSENLVSERPTFVPISGKFPKPADPPLADGKLSYGEFGPDVEKLQRALNNAGARDAEGKALNPDQDFGDRTLAAVKDYQRIHKQPQTGVADKQMLIDLGVIAPTQTQTQKPATEAPVETKPVSPTQGKETNPYGFGPDNELGKVIARGEGGYNSYNRGVAGDAKGAQIDFSQMTVAEVMRRQDLPKADSDRLFAVGKYQFTPNTLEAAVTTLGIDKNAKFTPQLQEKLFADYLIDEKRPQVRNYITGKTSGADGLESAQHALAQEFASVGTPRKDGRGYYDGDSAGNKASITPEQTGKALDSMREQYQKNIKAGMSAEDAYRALSGDPNNFTQSSGGVNQGQTKKGGGLDDTLLVKGEDGEGVKRLQRALNDAGIRDDKGQKLPETGHFGDLTEAAVRKFQEKNKLTPDGDAGKDTLTKLGIYPGQDKAATQDKPKPPADVADPRPVQKTESQPKSGSDAPSGKNDSQPPAPVQSEKPSIADPKHPDNRLYQQALSNLEQLGSHGGFASREQMEKAAAAVAADAKASGLKEIDHVSRTNAQNGESLLVAVQGDPTSPSSKNSYIGYNQAVAQPIDESTRMAENASAKQSQQPAAPDQQVVEPKRLASGM